MEVPEGLESINNLTSIIRNYIEHGRLILVNVWLGFTILWARRVMWTSGHKCERLSHVYTITIRWTCELPNRAIVHPFALRLRLVMPQIQWEVESSVSRQLIRTRHYSRRSRFHDVTKSGPEEFVNLQDLLVQSSKWFGISSEQFISPGTSMSGKFVQFSSEHRGQVYPFGSFSSVHSDQFMNFSGPGHNAQCYAIRNLHRPRGIHDWLEISWVDRWGY